MFFVPTIEDVTQFRAFVSSGQGRRCHVAFKKTLIGSDALFFAVRDEAQDNCAKLKPGRRYTAADVCGPFLWQRLHYAGLHRAMGLCVSFLVKSGLLPLVCVNPRAKGTKFYVVRD